MFAMKRTILHVFLLYLGLIFYPIYAEAAEEVKIEVNNTGWMLEFKLVNSSRELISIPKYSLPWSSSIGGVRLFAFCGMNNPKQMREVLTADYDPRFIELKPSEALNGTVDLRSRFPEIAACREIDLVTIFWFYRAMLEDEKAVGEFSGLFFLK